MPRKESPVEGNIRQLMDAGYIVAFDWISPGSREFVAAYAMAPGSEHPAMRAGDTIAEAVSILARDLKDCRVEGDQNAA